MGFLHAIADGILILSALLSLIAFGFLAYSGWLIYGLVKNVKGQVDLLSQASQEGLQEVRETSRFVSESVVKPAATAVGFATSIVATFKALASDVSRKRS